MTRWRIITEILTLSPCVAPVQNRSMITIITRKFKLDEKYGSDAKHLDRVFERIWCPHCNKYLPAYDGWRVRAFLNSYAGTRDQKDLTCYGIFAEEEDVYLLQKSVTNKEGKKTCINFEAVSENSTMHMVFDVPENLVKPIVEALNALVGKELKMPGLKSRGFNRIMVKKVSAIMLEDKADGGRKAPR